MVTEQGTVVGVAPEGVIVEVLRTSACQSCKARQGCGQAVLAEWGQADQQQQKNHFHIPTDQSLSVGTLVDLGMSEDAVSRTALLVYVLPLLVAFAAVLLIDTFVSQELWQLVAFIAGFLVTLFGLKQLPWLSSPALVPKILRTYPPRQDVEVIASTASKPV